MNKYWIPGPITNYGTTDAGFAGEVRVVKAADYDALAARLAEAERKHMTAARALVKAFNELNAIRARDGVPRDYAGMKVGVDEEYFSSVVDEVDAAMLALTGRGAHCHPLLYERAADSAGEVQK